VVFVPVPWDTLWSTNYVVVFFGSGRTRHGTGTVYRLGFNQGRFLHGKVKSTSQPLILRGAQSGLLTHIVTESVSLCTPVKTWLRLWNLNQLLKLWLIGLPVPLVRRLALFRISRKQNYTETVEVYKFRVTRSRYSASSGWNPVQ
jgi:hypothetical protein